LARTPDARDAFVAELELGAGKLPLLDRVIESVKTDLSKPQEEAGARRLVETMALALQGVVLALTAPSFVAEAFCEARLKEAAGLTYGALPGRVAADALIDRAMPTP
jgi:putative acyl-CoA dehydrogenase